MTNRLLLAAAVLLLVSPLRAQELVRRNVSWTFEGQNDPIVQITNEGEQSKALALRLLIDDSTYRHRPDLEVPSGENRFVRIRDILDRLLERYPELKGKDSGLLQIEFEGTDEEVKTRLVNLNPKGGITSEKDPDRIVSPVVRSVEPKAGSPAGGTVVTIVGEHFNDSTAVKFGGVPAMRNRQSEEVLIAIAPPHAAGSVDIEVANGKKSARLDRVFRYEWESPVITRVDPDNGPTKGGTKLTIEGRNFQPGTAVKWNGAPVSARFQSQESLTIVAPPGKSGSITLEILNPDGKNFMLPEAFTYKGLPQLLSVSPQSGSPEGGYTITVNGSNFEPGVGILFGSRYGQTTFINANTLAATVPSGESGYIDISVSTSDGETATLSRAFLYNEPPKILSVTVHPNPIVRNTTATITVEALDPELGSLEFAYRIVEGSAGGTISGQGNHAVYTSPNTTGAALIQVIVYDQHRAKTQSTAQIRVE